MIPSLALGAACLLAGTAASPAAEPRAFTVVPARKFQTIDHFGANDAWYSQMIGAWPEESKNKAADLLYSTDKGIGLSFCRFNVGAGINRKTISDRWRTSETFEIAEGQYDWNRLANQRWFLRAAKARGVKRFGLTFYSPPPRLTKNGLSNLGQDTTSTTNLIPGGEDAYARYITDILAHFKNHPDEAERIEFQGVFPVNEPQWEWQATQEGNRASNADLKRILTALHRRLESAGLRTRILGPESGCIADMLAFSANAKERWQADYGNYLEALGKDPAVAPCLGKLMTYHSYWSDRVPDQLVPEREALARAVAAMPGWQIWQSEYCLMEHHRDLTMDSALRMARVIHCDLAIANASAWQWWLGIAGEDYKSGLLYTDYKNPGDAENIIESKMFWTLGNYSRFIRPGAVRIGLDGETNDIQGVMGTAWLNAGATRPVLVLVNFSDAPREIRATFAPPEHNTRLGTRFVPYVTSESADLLRGETADLGNGYQVPARSVVTLVSVPGKE